MLLALSSLLVGQRISSLGTNMACQSPGRISLVAGEWAELLMVFPDSIMVRSVLRFSLIPVAALSLTAVVSGSCSTSIYLMLYVPSNLSLRFPCCVQPNFVHTMERAQMLANPRSLATHIITASSRSCSASISLTLLSRSDCLSTALSQFLSSTPGPPCWPRRLIRLCSEVSFAVKGPRIAIAGLVTSSPL